MGARVWLRRARREAGATATTIGVLAVGIAANVVVYQCVDRLVLNPLPLAEADRIVVVGSEMPRISQPLEYFEALSGPELAEIRAVAPSLRALLPFDLNSVRVQGADFPIQLFAAFVWADPLPLLGVEPELGRSFTADEIARGDAVALLSQSAWVRDFGGDPSILGRAVTFDGLPHVVVGVLPAHATVYGVEVWLPMRERLEDLPRDRRQFNLLARIAEDRELDQVNAELLALAGRIERALGREDEAYTGWRLHAASFARTNASSYSDEAVLTMAASLLILLLICVNLGNLALVRGVQRRAPASVRLALGGDGRSLTLDAVGEAIALGATGGIVGLALGAATFVVFEERMPGVIQPLGPALRLDGSGVLFGLMITGAASLVLATASAGALRGIDPRGALQGGGRHHGSRSVRRVQRTLVAAQLALGLALASGAGAVGTALARLLLVDPGFAAEELVSMRLSLPPDLYQGDGVPFFFQGLMDGTANLPGVVRTAVATQVAPFTFFSGEVETEDMEVEADARPRMFHTVVGGAYFATMGIPIVAGRALDGRDRAGDAPAVVVNQAAAVWLFRGGEALGRRIRVRGTRFDSGWAEIVGVSADVRHRGPDQPAAPEIFTAHAQAGERYRQMYLVARAADDPGALVPAIREEVRRLDPAQPLYAITTGEAALSSLMATRKVAAALLLALSFLAVALAALGLHGVLTYAVATRRRELAVRASLGAAPEALRRLLFREVAAVTAAGLGAGLLCTWWLGWLLRASLGDAASWSVPVVAGAAAVLALAALLATARPALRVGRTDPVEALRAEG